MAPRDFVDPRHIEEGAQMQEVGVGLVLDEDSLPLGRREAHYPTRLVVADVTRAVTNVARDDSCLARSQAEERLT